MPNGFESESGKPPKRKGRTKWGAGPRWYQRYRKALKSGFTEREAARFANKGYPLNNEKVKMALRERLIIVKKLQKANKSINPNITNEEAWRLAIFTARDDMEVNLDIYSNSQFVHDVFERGSPGD